MLTRESNFRMWLLKKSRKATRRKELKIVGAAVCPYGHEYTPENTYLYVDKKGHKQKRCKVCHSEINAIVRATNGHKGYHHNSIKTHCRRGHQYSGENLSVCKRTGKRRCKECRRLLDKRSGPRGPRPTKTHCPNKHEYNEENLYYLGNRRRCRKCAVAATLRWREKKLGKLSGDSVGNAQG